MSPDSRPAAPSASSCVNSERTPASPTKDRVRAVLVALAEDMVLKEDAARSTPSFDLEACGEVGWEVEAFKAFEPSMCISNELHQNNRNQPHTHVSTNEHVALIQRERERETERERDRDRERERQRQRETERQRQRDRDRDRDRETESARETQREKTRVRCAARGAPSINACRSSSFKDAWFKWMSHQWWHVLFLRSGVAEPGPRCLPEPSVEGDGRSKSCK